MTAKRKAKNGSRSMYQRIVYNFTKEEAIQVFGAIGVDVDPESSRAAVVGKLLDDPDKYKKAVLKFVGSTI